MNTRRVVSLSSSLLVGALALAACGSNSGSGGSGGSGSGKTIKIGYEGPLSGDNQQLGINMENGVKLAIKQANDSGKHKFKLVYVSADDQGNPAQAPAAARKLIQDSQVLAVVGPAFSGATAAAEPAYVSAGLVTVSPSATRPDLTGNNWKTFFRIVPPDSAQGVQAADYMAKKLSAKKVFSVNDQSAYGKGLSDVLEPQLQKDGVTVVKDSIAPTQDYSAEAQKAVASNADVLYYSGYYGQFSLFAKALKQAGFKGTLMSDDGSKDPQFIAQAGADNAEGVQFSCPCVPSDTDPKYADFNKAYKSAYNSDPGTYSPEAYDATNAIISALDSTGSSASRSSVLNAVKNVDYTGLTKEIKFQPNGEVTQVAIFVYQVQSGQIKYIGQISQLVGG